MSNVIFSDSKRKESRTGSGGKERERSKERDKTEKEREKSRDRDKENDKDKDRRKQVPYLPVYNAHPYIMRTLFFKTLSRKKIVIPIVIKATNRNIFSAKYNKIFFSITVYYKYP